MKVLGLTGGIGMGKSACAELLRLRGVVVVDTDLLARQIVEPGEPALREIEQAFGPQVLEPSGRLSRRKLAEFVFADRAARLKLEEILHPRIRELWRAQVEEWRTARRTLAVVVIPLLFETKAEKELDATICVACSTQTQRERLTPRGWSPEQMAQRIAAQLPVETKMARANYVIWSEGSLDIHAAQLDCILLGLNHAG